MDQSFQYKNVTFWVEVSVIVGVWCGVVEDR